MKKYSQNNEQDCILSYFGDKNNGRFLDIGGFDAFVFSNTRSLAEKDWSGIILEPSPICYDKLVNDYGNYKKVNIINIGIGSKTGKKRFYDSRGDAVSTFDKAHKLKWENGSKVIYDEIEVLCVSVDDFFIEWGFNFDFVDIDIEGKNFELVQTLPEELFKRTSLFCIEHDGKNEEIYRHMKVFGYRQLELNGENVILGK